MTTPLPGNTTAVENLFRREAGRISAAVVRLVGLAHLDLAEDVVNDALVQALEVWKFRGLPDNPTAWLMAAAKHRAIDVIRRERTARRFAPEVADQLSTEWSLVPTVAAAFEEKEIVDAELRLMFELCHGRLPEETQVMVILKYLCGFGVRELAQAFLSGEEAIEKRLCRARATLQAVGGHRFVDVLDEPGEDDLSSHVDFAALTAAARRGGASVAGPVTQGAFLANLGIAERAEQLMKANPAEAQNLLAATERLIGNDTMGRLFKALALTPPAITDVAGFPP